MASGQIESIDALLTMLAGQYLHIASVPLIAPSLSASLASFSLVALSLTQTVAMALYFSVPSFFILHRALIIVAVNL